MSPTKDYTVHLGSREISISADQLAETDIISTGHNHNTFHLVKEGKTYTCAVDHLDLPAKLLRVNINGQQFELTVKDDIDALVAKLGLGVVTQAASKNVHAPMPGLVIDVLVEPGQEVTAGTKLLILEAMKMENSLIAEADGIVQSIEVAKGDAVDKRQLLIEVA